MTRETFLHWLSNTGLLLCASFIALFLGDYLVLRIRIAAHGPGAVTAKISTYEAALLKDNKYNVFFDQPQVRTCVRSIFPWLGDDPCWYLRRHALNVVN